MSNEAIPEPARTLLKNNFDKCLNLGLALDKYAPWSIWKQGADWSGDLTLKRERRRKGQVELADLQGGEAKGAWLDTSNYKAKQGETPSLFAVERTDMELAEARCERWLASVEARKGMAFEMQTAERLVVGLGAGHVLETAITLDRSSGTPYLPGSSLKGLARTHLLFEVARQLNVTLERLTQLEDALISQEDDEIYATIEKSSQQVLTEDMKNLIAWFRIIFGTMGNAGAVCFMDAMYAGKAPPLYVADTMTPHYVDYYTTSGSKPPSEDGDPQPVTFLTVDSGALFWFGLLPRIGSPSVAQGVQIAIDLLKEALARLGAGGKTAAGYGYFSPKSYRVVCSPQE